MNTVTPIVIQISSSGSSHCPECGKQENIKRVCRHCGHEYRDDDVSGWRMFLFIVGVFFVLWVFLTVGYWLLEQSYHRLTLLEVLKGQWEFFRGLHFMHYTYGNADN